jgi:1-aminocyclopropane-1-carboxylate deaminase/D-cysteine desulfhydrase-like pyridoxal-dependent ACC family enzyme
VAVFPRVRFAHLPTPLEELPRFSQALGGPRVFIKRDDCTGLLFGGNKTRHNEFLFGEARRQNADVFVWASGVQSNSCRQTVAACNKLGIECHLYLSRAERHDDVQGNLLLDVLMGAKIHITDIPLGPELERLLLAKAEELKLAGRRPFICSPATSRSVASVSYLLCMAEIAEQAAELDMQPTAIYAAAVGATATGLVLGKSMLGMSAQVQLCSPIVWPWNMAADIAQGVNQTARSLKLPLRVSAGEVQVRTDFVGSAYGVVTRESREAIRLLAHTEGILLDPIYTGKAMAALIHDIRIGRLTHDDTVVFIHTGGTPAVFAYRDELLQA